MRSLLGLAKTIKTLILLNQNEYKNNLNENVIINEIE